MANLFDHASSSSRSRPGSPDAVLSSGNDNSSRLSGAAWQPILHSSNQLVLYNPTSHALSIMPSENQIGKSCFYCKQLLPEGFVPPPETPADEEPESFITSEEVEDPMLHSRVANYFQLLEIANETASRPATPPPIADAEDRTSRAGTPQTGTFPPESMAEGYFKAFFKEELRLGMGANGSVYLCQHVLDGNPLGHFAVKKIAVGESHSYLLRILREVKLLERLRHPNIITYHHSWLETAQFSSFGPRVPTLHVLMQWAEGGSLDDFIDVRLGRGSHHIHINPLARFSAASPGITQIHNSPFASSATLEDRASPHPMSGSDNIHSRSARIRAFRAFQRAPSDEKAKIRAEQKIRGAGDEPSMAAIHLFSAEEVKSLFSDVVEGLEFLHSKSILHLDLKPGNVLLTWDEGRLIPRAMLSDFGTSRDMISGSRVRSGNTGTMEYSSPESLPHPDTGLLGSVDSKADMWSLGMILHKMLFFYLPYRYAADGDVRERPISSHAEPDKLEKLEQEVLNYPGFKQTPALAMAFKTRHLPLVYLILLENLLNVDTHTRPSSDRILQAIREGRLDPVGSQASTPNNIGTLVPAMRKPSYMDPGAPLAPSQVSGAGEDNFKRPPMLRLPSPRDLASFHSSNSQRQRGPSVPLAPWSKAISFVWNDPMKRAVKSLVLTAKVYSAITLCSQETPVLRSALIALAVLDMTIVDHWTWSLVLGVAHAGALGLIRWRGL